MPDKLKIEISFQGLDLGFPFSFIATLEIVDLIDFEIKILHILMAV